MQCNSLSPPYSASGLLVEWEAINDSPDYQREAGVWSVAKQQLFIDTMLNRYDVPKLYFHDLRRNESTHHKFAVVDGKQRLRALRNFLIGDLALGFDTEIPTEDKGLTRQKPRAGQKISDLDDYWKARIRDFVLPIVVIQDANEEDIEDLFLRLNNGEPLTGAEKRNAMGGKMCQLIRDIAGHKFFSRNIAFGIGRYQHYEAAAKFLLMEQAAASSGEIYCILKKRFLDEMTKQNRAMTKAAGDGLKKSVFETLDAMAKIFGARDPLLRRSATPQIYYAFCREIRRQYAHKTLHRKIHSFLEGFHRKRLENLRNEDEDARDPELINFDRLMSQNNDSGSMRERVRILTRHFLADHSDVALKDSRRNFDEDERYVVWLQGGKKCVECGVTILLKDMDADHIKPYAHGGKTILSNARALCVNCNRSGGARARQPQTTQQRAA